MGRASVTYRSVPIDNLRATDRSLRVGSGLRLRSSMMKWLHQGWILWRTGLFPTSSSSRREEIWPNRRHQWHSLSQRCELDSMNTVAMIYWQKTLGLIPAGGKMILINKK